MANVLLFELGSGFVSIFIDFDAILFVLEISFVYTPNIKIKVWKYISQANIYQKYS